MPSYRHWIWSWMGGTAPREELGAWLSLYLWEYQWGQTLAKSPIPLEVPDKDENEEIEACHRACALPEMAITPPPSPDTGKEEKGTPRPPEAAVEDRQVKFDDKALNWGLSKGYKPVKISPSFL